MTEAETTLTLNLPVREGVRLHIESLQTKLTERNAQIERLTEALRIAEAGESNRTALGRSYQRGWKDCANSLISTTQEAARSLGRVRKDALDIYYEPERKEREEQS